MAKNRHPNSSLKGLRFGKSPGLSAEEIIRYPGDAKKELWRCRCQCGQTRDVLRRSLLRGNIHCCEACADRRGRQDRVSAYLTDYRRFRSAFTPQQRDRYVQLLTGRDFAKDRRVQAEAVEQVMMETDLAGACCVRCAAGLITGVNSEESLAFEEPA